MKKKNIFAVISLDVSSSMSNLSKQAQKIYDDTVKSLINEADDTTNVFVSLVTFGSEVKVINKLTQDIKNLKYDYSAYGNTKLFDAIGKSINILESADVSSSDAAIMICITDGCENDSVLWNSKTIKKLMEDKDQFVNWTLAFNLPKGYKDRFIRQFDIADKNCREWEVSTQGLEETNIINTRSISNYATSFKSGDLHISSKSFYAQATVDDQGINTKVLKNNLTKVTDKFISLKVSIKQQIRDFIENHGFTYNKGGAFYELTKREIIQPTKEIVIQDHNKDLYTGDDARNLLGLPTNVYSKVRPADHPNYTIYVQSTSVNRLISPATTVLYKV